ncbi:hypothetical protein JAAARDRAFT_124750 [Jaapia argillacea MUCL 33604]|uniref:Cyclin-like domain-containing protein n=1 Tax=Jaapia argillacea MUCL 33604 TaxID=933084 RepID=A0A067Q1A3_9AGAM|nr:hypothetical protein JAAARDRAFT_124750 [Jaapia argillacea MUCL 33604]
MPQWLFPVSALNQTPSFKTSAIPLGKELYDRARGVELLYRLGTSLALPSSAMFTAATWFHRFYMRYSMEDYHRQDVAASCIFLATKTEECGRKLKDVAKVFQMKITGVEADSIPTNSKEVEQRQTAILLTEEALLEALCFDFVVDSPHADLVDLFRARDEEPILQEYAWSFAHDSYRTPLCVLYPPRIIAAACYVLAQCIVEGPHSPSLDARISFPPPTATLPTPPSHKPASPDASRFAIEYFGFKDLELLAVADSLSIILEFYGAQYIQGSTDHLQPIMEISAPSHSPPRPQLYQPFSQFSGNLQGPAGIQQSQGRTPSSSHGGSTPLKTSSRTHLSL